MRFDHAVKLWLGASLLLCLHSPAQSPVDKAWSVLQTGLADKGDNKATAVRALGLLRNHARAIDLATSALGDTDTAVRAAAAESLGHMQAKAAIPLLAGNLKTEKEVSVVLAEANALVELGDPRGFDIYYAVLTGTQKSGASLMDEQKKMLHDPKKMAEFGLDQGMGFVPFGSLGLGAFRALTKDDVSPVRAGAARVLAKDPDPKTEAALVEAAADKSWLVRTAALNALAQHDDPVVVPKIASALDDEKEVVRYTAAAAIIHLSEVRPRGRASK